MCLSVCVCTHISLQMCLRECLLACLQMCVIYEGNSDLRQIFVWWQRNRSWFFRWIIASGLLLEMEYLFSRFSSRHIVFSCFTRRDEKRTLTWNHALSFWRLRRLAKTACNLEHSFESFDLQNYFWTKCPDRKTRKLGQFLSTNISCNDIQPLNTLVYKGFVTHSDPLLFCV